MVEKIFRYLAGSITLGLIFRKDSPDHLIDYLDSDYAGLKDGRKSTDAYTFLLAGAAISYTSKLQPTVRILVESRPHRFTARSSARPGGFSMVLNISICKRASANWNQ